jgi:geranylgeranyl diphosphate synthase type II
MFDTKSKMTISLEDVDAYMLRCTCETSSPVSDAARYHLTAGGARVRARIGLDAAIALGLSPTTALACAAAPELLHNASLIQDDLQDGDALRRNMPAVWSRYGRDAAISSGDLLISAAYKAIALHPNAGAAICAMHDAVSVTIRGQAQDCSARNHSSEDCAGIAADKSGPLLDLPVRLALIAADAPGQEVAIRAGRAIAIAYQTLDDFVDKAADRATSATNICLSLEAEGHDPAAAISVARTRAQAALMSARQDARDLPNSAGTPLLTLVNRLEAQLKELDNAA